MLNVLVVVVVAFLLGLGLRPVLDALMLRKWMRRPPDEAPTALVERVARSHMVPDDDEIRKWLNAE